jgi:hypothetical protein
MEVWHAEEKNIIKESFLVSAEQNKHDIHKLRIKLHSNKQRMPQSLAAQVSQCPWNHSTRMPYGKFTRDALTAKVLLEIKDTPFNVSALTTALIAEKDIAFSTMELVARIVDIGLEGKLKLTIKQIRVLLQAMPLLTRGPKCSKLVKDFYEECGRKWPSEDHDNIISVGDGNQNAVLMELQEFIIFLNRAKLDYAALRYQQLMAPYVEKETQQAEQTEQAKKKSTTKKRKRSTAAQQQPLRRSTRNREERVFLMHEKN